MIQSCFVFAKHSWPPFPCGKSRAEKQAEKTERESKDGREVKESLHLK
jgi:hypothetical protein